MIGRTFTPADDEPGGSAAGAAAVISYNFWQRHSVWRNLSDVVAQGVESA
jgi:hypothetical protein